MTVLGYNRFVGKLKTPKRIITKIANLRSKGNSISEISIITGKSKSVVSKYIQNIEILPKYKLILKNKQNSSKVKSQELWNKSLKDAQKMIKKINLRDKIFLLIGIYWGEGTKKELNIINSDPILLRAFLNFIKELGVTKYRIKASIRLYNDINQAEAIKYWSNILDLDKNQFCNIELLKGNKNGKLKFGMCRLRVEKSSKEFKLLMSLIYIVKGMILPS